MSTRLGEQTPQEKLEQATQAMVSARMVFLDFNHKLKQFDVEHPSLNAELTEERESLVRLYDQALEILREKEGIQKFMHHECYAIVQRWGRGPEPWRR
jgi:hypothetical protein